MTSSPSTPTAVFQHTAAQRRLLDQIDPEFAEMVVSTHSRAEAAADEFAIFTFK